ncbi:hypothetical protein GQ600_6447 [Phytophthora cactorum]|nr:hypothetical protein GQ600_6447 [Phytophthora cactorum]
MRVFHIVLLAIASLNDDTGKRFLRKAHAENEEGSAGEESEERAQWTEVLKKLKSETFKRAKLELWFQQGKDPAFARQKFNIPASGEAMKNHKNYKYLQIFIKNHLASKISYNLLDADDVMPWGLQKPRIQRLLPGPGQNGPQEWSSSRQSMTQSPSTLARLPDSPPRLLSVRLIERTETSKEASPARSRDATSVPSTFEANFSQKEEAADAPHSPAEIRGNLEDANPSSSTELDSDDSKSKEIESDTHQFEPDKTTIRSSTSTRQSSVDDEVSTGAKKGNNFIERNKQVVANGMKANMTKEEEDRLEKLLRDEIILVVILLLVKKMPDQKLKFLLRNATSSH